MTTADYSKIESQLNGLGYTDDNLDGLRIRESVLELFHTLDAQDLSRAQEAAVISLFENLVNGDRLSSEYASETGHQAHWEEFKIGETRPGATVRVRADAYEGSAAKHNRLVGTLVAIRGGRAVVQYTGRNDGVGHNHHPEMLEVLEK